MTARDALRDAADNMTRTRKRAVYALADMRQTHLGDLRRDS